MDKNNNNFGLVLDGPETWKKTEVEEKETIVPKQRKPRVPKVKNRKYSIDHLKQDGLTALIDTFLNGGRKNKHNYFSIEGNELIHTAPTELNRWGRNNDCRTVIARKIGEEFVGNASILPQVGRHCAYGSIQPNNSETEVQRRLSTLVTMVPFTVFEEAKLSISKMRIIEKAKAETVARNRDRWDSRTGKTIRSKEIVHYTGAALFSIGDKCFLFDIDRNEIKHGIFNAFLVELSAKVKTIAEAYESLKPTEVKKAKGVLRQGEFFFIPVSKKELALIQKFPEAHKKIELRVGPNRPNEASKGIQFDSKGKALGNVQSMLERLQDQDDVDWELIEKLEAKLGDISKVKSTFVTGKIEHTGREHKNIVLKSWYRVVPNTAVRSFTIRGDVD